MPVRNAHWYSRNEGISYPLDDAATCADDRGELLPNNIITDLMLRWPTTYGRYAFLSSVVVTDRIVSLTFQAAETIDATDGFSPLAVVTLTQPIDESRQVSVQGQVDGVAGWVVFGRGVATPYRGRFSSPSQSRLTARAARAYRQIPVTGIRTVDAATPLIGIVNLRAQSPLTIGKETRSIEGVDRDCIVLRLSEGGDLGEFPVPDEATRLIGVKDASVFQQFAGPCAGRPESRTCGDPEPIEFINAVGPDCEGVVTVVFAGCAVAAQILDVCGIALDCGQGLAEACPPPEIPDADGRLPSEYDPVIITPPDDVVPPPSSESDSESIIVIGELPYYDCFLYATANYFQVKSGLWDVIVATVGDPYRDCGGNSVSDSNSDSTSDSDEVILPAEYVLAGRTAAARNIITWEGFDETTLERKLTTHFRMIEGPSGTRYNGGVVLNYRPHATVSGQFVYFLAEIEYETQTVRLSRFNGTSIQVIATFTQPGILLNTWYAVTCWIRQVGSKVSIEVHFASLADVSVDVTIGPVLVSNYTPSTGYFGLHANRALTEFSSFTLEALDG